MSTWSPRERLAKKRYSAVSTNIADTVLHVFHPIHLKLVRKETKTHGNNKKESKKLETLTFFPLIYLFSFLFSRKVYALTYKWPGFYCIVLYCIEIKITGLLKMKRELILQAAKDTKS